MGRPYNGWSSDERNKIGDIQVAMLRQQPEYRHTVCKGCGATKGIVQHLEDYSEPLKGIIGLCCRCHVAVHERFRHPQMWARYRQALREGWVLRRGTDWRSVLQDMCWSTIAFAQAVEGPERGETILDEIATGKWLNARAMATGPVQLDNQLTLGAL